jgi:hypothetical protein
MHGSLSSMGTIVVPRLSNKLTMMSEYDIAKASGITVLPGRFSKATKQLATLGPASSNIEMIEKLFLAGADIFRLNFSHGEHKEKARLVDIIRQIEKKYDHPICILADLQVHYKPIMYC